MDSNKTDGEEARRQLHKNAASKSWTSPGGNTPQDTTCTATCLLSRKLFKLDEPDMQDTAGEAGTSSKVMYSYGPPYMAVQKQDDQHEHTFSNYVRIQDVVLKTCLRRWTIGNSGERGSGKSVLSERHDDDEIILDFDTSKFPAKPNIIAWEESRNSKTTALISGKKENIIQNAISRIYALKKNSYFLVNK